MLKKLFYISLAVSACLLLAGGILLPFAAKQTVEQGLALFTNYYREGTAYNTLPILEDTKLSIQADNLEINLHDSPNDKLWVRYHIFGGKNPQVDFTEAENNTLSLNAIYEEATPDKENEIKSLMQITPYRGSITVYIPQGMEYEVVGEPYSFYDWAGSQTIIDEVSSEVITEEQLEEKGYPQLKEQIFQLMQDYPSEYIIQNKGNEVIFKMNRTDFFVDEDLSLATIGDGYIEIDAENITINGNTFYIPDDNIQISKNIVRVGKYMFMV